MGNVQIFEIRDQTLINIAWRYGFDDGFAYYKAQIGISTEMRVRMDADREEVRETTCKVEKRLL